MNTWFGLKIGDVITHKQSGDGYIVMMQVNNGHQLVLTRTILASNPHEWERLYKDDNPANPYELIRANETLRSHCEQMAGDYSLLIDVMLDTLNSLDAEYGPSKVDVNFPRLRKMIQQKGMKR